MIKFHKSIKGQYFSFILLLVNYLQVLELQVLELKLIFLKINGVRCFCLLN